MSDRDGDQGRPPPFRQRRGRCGPSRRGSAEEQGRERGRERQETRVEFDAEVEFGRRSRGGSRREAGYGAGYGPGYERDWRAEGKAAAEEALRGHDDGHDGYGRGYGRGRGGAGDGDGRDPFRSPNPHRLYRNTKDGKIAGVCAGIADYVNIDAWIVRVGLIIGLIFFPPVFAVGYVVLWGVLKKRPPHLYENPEEEVFWRSVTTKPDQTLAGLKTKFRELDRQIVEMETYIASKEFDLHRQFRDLEKK